VIISALQVEWIMPVRILDRGRYEIFETNHGHEILGLDGKEGKKWFAVVRGQKGDILVRSGPDHTKDHTISQGRFYLVDFIQDPKFNDVPHLFLERNARYEEWILPNGLPTSSDPQKRVVLTNDTIAKEELEQYLKHPAPPGQGEERSRRR
jgi:hypothetical protein